MTLPFSAGKVSSEFKARVVERTKERWSWFSYAQYMDKESNTRFGTLGYLPSELRRRIYDLLQFDHCTTEHDWYLSKYRSDPTEFYLSTYFEHEAGIFDFRFNNGKCGNHCCTSRSLRLQHTSSSLRHEYRDNLLASGCFIARNPANVRGLLRSLTSHQQLQLRRLILNISVQLDLSGTIPHYEYVKYLDWRRICSHLPSTLTSVVLDAMNLNYVPIDWREFPLGEDLHTYLASKEILKKLECELLATDVICKGIKNRASNAKFSVRLPDLVDSWYSPFFDAVLAEYS